MQNQGRFKQCQICKNRVQRTHWEVHTARCERVMKSTQKSETKFKNNSMRQQKTNQSKNQKEISIQRSEEETQKILCHLCGYQQSLQELDTHGQNCQNKQVACEYCQIYFPLSLMPSHHQVCRRRRFAPEVRMPIRRLRRDRRDLLFTEDQPQEAQDSDSFQQMLPQIARGSRRWLQVHSRFISIMPNSQFLQRFMLDYSFLALIRILARRNNEEEELQGLNKTQINQIKTLKYVKKQECEKQECEKCSICYCDFVQNESVKKLKCSHQFHAECIGKWLQINAVCPLCKCNLKNVVQSSQESVSQQFL